MFQADMCMACQYKRLVVICGQSAPMPPLCLLGFIGGRIARKSTYPAEFTSHRTLPELEDGSAQEWAHQPSHTTNTHQRSSNDKHRIQTSELRANVLNLELCYQGCRSNNATGSGEDGCAEVDIASSSSQLEKVVPRQCALRSL